MISATTVTLRVERIPKKRKKKKNKKSQYRKLALEKKIRPPLLPELEPATF